MGFFDPVMEVSKELQQFHYGVMCVVVFIVTFVLYWMWWVGSRMLSWRGWKEHKWLEFMWCLVPSVVLFMLALPSLHLLYVMDEIGSPTFCAKVVGHQWYWSYEFSGENGDVLGFDSFMEQEVGGKYRMLDVDQRMVAPINTGVRWMVTSTDVIHSFTLPATMLKVDAVPGRINEVPMMVGQCGVLYGQCSEICGANHSFMPIVVEFVPMGVFNRWWSKMKENESLVVG